MIFNVNGGGGGVDIRDTTAVPSYVREGDVFYLSNGTRALGTMPSISFPSVFEDTSIGVPLSTISLSTYLSSYPSALYLNIPSGYMSSSAFYSFSGVSQATIASYALGTQISGMVAYPRFNVDSGYFSAGVWFTNPGISLISRSMTSSEYEMIFPTLNKIGSYAFAGDIIGWSSHLSAQLDNLLILGTGAFYSNSCITAVNMPKYTGYFPSYAFSGCLSLSQIYCPSAKGSVGSYAFARTKLTEFSMVSCSSVYEYAFYSCTSLVSLSLPGCTSIGGSAFAYCYKLSFISQPEVGTVGESAFFSCRSLSYAYLPSASYLGAGAFQYCSLLQSVTFSSVINGFFGSVFNGCSSLTTINSSNVITISSTIGTMAFSGCRSLQSIAVVFSASTGNTHISEYAFAYCSSLSYAYFIYKNGVSPRLYAGAFQNCSNLFSIYFISGNTVNLLSQNAFWGTPISTSSGGVYGSVYLPASLSASYLGQTNWIAYSKRLVWLTEDQISSILTDLGIQ